MVARAHERLKVVYPDPADTEVRGSVTENMIHEMLRIQSRATENVTREVSKYVLGRIVDVEQGFGLVKGHVEFVDSPNCLILLEESGQRVVCTIRELMRNNPQLFA